MRTFTLIRKLLLVHSDVIHEIEMIKKTINDQDGNIQIIFEYLEKLEQTKQQELSQKSINPVGYKRKADQ